VESSTKVLIIDDKPDESSTLATALKTRRNISAVVRHPNDVEEHDLRGATLILADYGLDSWSERDSLEVLGCKPLDGLALASVIRSHTSKINEGPVAFGIYTGKVEEIAGPLPPELRNHAAARLSNIEWIFEKGSKGVADQVVCLARAVRNLPTKWIGDANEPLLKLLGLLEVNENDFSNVVRNVEACQPPIHEISEWSQGLAIIRWLLHRIFPYPCFLWDIHYLAARLGLTLESTNTLLEQPNFQKKLASCEYRGLLADFDGKRWWRSKLELMLWELSEGNSGDLTRLQEVVQKLTRKKLDRLPGRSAVVCIDSRYRQIKNAVDMDLAVRVRPDDWPPYADSAWATIASVKKHEKMRALVLDQDRERILS